MKQIEIPKIYRKELLDLPNEAFADDKNRVFPLDNFINIEESATNILNNELSFYDKDEKIYILERLANAAKEYDINLKSYIIEGGKESMSVDKNSAEFKQALAEALDIEIKKVESGEELEALKKQVSDATLEIKNLGSEIENTKNLKEKVSTEFDLYKQSIEIGKLAEARLQDLTDKGFDFKDNAKYIKSAIARMSQNSFEGFLSILTETFNMGKASIDVKKDKEDKEDPVKGSKEAIASKVEDDNEKSSVVDDCLKQVLGL